jgi:phospholipase C
MLRVTAAAFAVAFCAVLPPSGSPAWGADKAARAAIPIQHVVIIMQENRSFDSYFGTYPNANGIPQGTCVPMDPANPNQGCVAPFHDQHDVNSGGNHGSVNAQADLDDGITTAKMDGFVKQQDKSFSRKPGQRELFDPGGFLPGLQRHDVMGYHTDAELPNYWSYAENFVLQDEMFEGVRAFSGSAHIDMTSEWVATCKSVTDVSTCTTNPHVSPPNKLQNAFPWVNLFQLLDIHGISWKYYLADGVEPDCDDDEMTCDPQIQAHGVLSLWNPVPGYNWVVAKGQAYLAAHNPDADQFLLDVKSGNLPQVSWIVPSLTFSEHPDQGITQGQEYVTSLINAIMQSPYWASTAIFVSWDDWGGFYDHVVPPNVDTNRSKTPIQGFGLRVPGLMISAYAKKGYIDHAVLSTDSYATFMEDVFINGDRLDPVQLGEPDARPDIRDELTVVHFPNGSSAPVGDLMNEFDFTQQPRPPLVLSTHIPTGIKLTCDSKKPYLPENCRSTTVMIGWRPVTGPEIPGPFTYQVLRDGVVVPACTGTNSKCQDKDVPAGTHYYTVRSIDQNAITSPASAAAEADVP